MTQQQIINPKAFISYSWTSPEHEAWVLRLATELREVGIDVILDKWDLKEGHDAIAFMEQIVTKSEIKKVILICDQKYTEKTDGRKGGVGTEAQIISPAIYTKADENKFVAVASELGADGMPFLPAYYRGRIYIDLSSNQIYAENFEKLVRWVYDKPIHAKPVLGKVPNFLMEDSGPGLVNGALHRRALNAIRDAKPFARGALDEYLGSCVSGLEAFRISGGGESDFDEKVINSIESFLPYRGQLIEVFCAVAQYRDLPETHQQMHRFFERLLPYLNRPEGVSRWYEEEFDNFRFIVHELFLYLVAVLLRQECFEFAARMLRQPYYLAQGRCDGETTTTTFRGFCSSLQSLGRRNQRLGINRLSLHAELLEQRSHASGVDFQHLLQADFVLFVRGALDALRSRGHQWWPETMVFCDEHRGAFEMFARSQSAEYFSGIMRVFDIKSKQEFVDMLEAFKAKKLHSPTWRFHHINSVRLLGFDRLATIP